MAATVSSFEVTSLRCLCPIFHSKNWFFLLYLLVAVFSCQCFSAADEHDFTDDFFKKEYSLAKPYSGKFAHALSSGVKNRRDRDQTGLI